MLLHFSPVKVDPDEKDFLFAGSFPTSPGDFQRLKEEHGVTRVVNLTVDTAYWFPVDPSFTLHRIPIADFEAPKMDQVEEFIGILCDAKKAGERVYVHCQAGIGRTGTMLACWFLAQDLNLGGKGAIQRIRDIRAPSIESDEQEEAVLDFARHLGR